MSVRRKRNRKLPPDLISGFEKMIFNNLTKNADPFVGYCFSKIFNTAPPMPPEPIIEDHGYAEIVEPKQLPAGKL
jgi:hypothetical protein